MPIRQTSLILKPTSGNKPRVLKTPIDINRIPRIINFLSLIITYLVLLNIGTLKQLMPQPKVRPTLYV